MGHGGVVNPKAAADWRGLRESERAFRFVLGYFFDLIRVYPREPAASKGRSKPQRQTTQATVHFLKFGHLKGDRLVTQVSQRPFKISITGRN